MQLMFEGASAHRAYFSAGEVQRCTLLSIKTGGCSEDCSYCSQSSKYKTDVESQRLLDTESVLNAAQNAKNSGSTRFCMGAAWRGVSSVGKGQFNRVLDMITQIRAMDMEVCATLGMVNEEQASLLKQAGLTAYNHNIDTSEEYYPSVISTRTFQDRLETLKAVRSAGLSVCCGGIVGLGESDTDRISMLHTLSTLESHPESVPINALVANKGTPLEDSEPVDCWTLVRMIATARILMPASMVRLSAGRSGLSEHEQALCFMAGANSIFTGDKLLTTPNVEMDQDDAMFQKLGLFGKKPFGKESEHAKQFKQSKHTQQQQHESHEQELVHAAST